MVQIHGSDDAFRTGDWQQFEAPTQPPPLTAPPFIEPSNTTVITTPTTSTTTPKPVWKTDKTTLLFNHCEMNFLPMGMGKVFPKMTSLLVFFSDLTFLKQNNFNEMMNLYEISFQDNLIEKLPESVFANVPTVKSLNLGGNKVKELPVFLLEKQSALEIFIANRNLIEILPKELFKFNKSLKFINLSNNRIVYIELDFSLLKGLVQVLGIGNTCADFYLNKSFDQAKLTALVKSKCNTPPKRNGTTTVRT